MRNIGDIDNILNDLNEEIDNYSAGMFRIKADFEMMSRFTYETAGYYCWIKFGDEILWDSENEPREFFEETNEYEDLKTFIKKQFNAYVNTVKRFRFSDVTDENKLSEAYDAADEIINVIEETRVIGHEWEILAECTKDEIYDKIGAIIAKYN